MAKQAIDAGIECDLTTGLRVEELCYAQVPRLFIHDSFDSKPQICSGNPHQRPPRGLKSLQGKKATRFQRRIEKYVDNDFCRLEFSNYRFFTRNLPKLILQ